MPYLPWRTIPLWLHAHLYAFVNSSLIGRFLALIGRQKPVCLARCTSQHTVPFLLNCEERSCRVVPQISCILERPHQRHDHQHLCNSPSYSDSSPARFCAYAYVEAHKGAWISRMIGRDTKLRLSKLTLAPTSAVGFNGERVEAIRPPNFRGAHSKLKDAS